MRFPWWQAGSTDSKGVLMVSAAMYELVFIVCLITAPDVCETRHLAFQRAQTSAGCLWQGQLRMARWLERNPRWRVKGWRCGLPEA